MPLGCGCLFALFAVSMPRLALLFVWLFTDLVTRAFQSAVLGPFFTPLLGIIFLPFTTLMYVIVWSPIYGVSGWAWFWVGLGLLLDISAYSGSAYGNRNRMSGSYRMPA